MRLRICTMVLLTTVSTAQAQFIPTPYAATELDVAKNTCMLNSSMERKGRHPELSPIKPNSWNPGFEECEEIWGKWQKQISAGNNERQKIRDAAIGQEKRAADDSEKIYKGLKSKPLVNKSNPNQDADKKLVRSVNKKVSAP